jgi:hypothetical protein
VPATVQDDVDGLIELQQDLHAKVIGRRAAIFRRKRPQPDRVGQALRSVRRARHLGGVFIAALLCSDEACAEELDLVVDDLARLDAAACACGCTLVVLSVSDWSAAELPVFA